MTTTPPGPAGQSTLPQRRARERFATALSIAWGRFFDYHVRPKSLLAAFVAVIIVMAIGWVGWESVRARSRLPLWREIKPIQLANCTMRRYGEANDGGYVMCENLMGQASAAYSYGIAGNDAWGCEISEQLGCVVHEYDCFDLRHPQCPTGRLSFHAECVGPRTELVAMHRFDTMAAQIAKNGDQGRRLVVKMDVEGSEWESLFAAPDSLLDAIEQMSIELHGVNRQDASKLLQRLKQFFYVADVHFNNSKCANFFKNGEIVFPFPGSVFEVLLVSKRLGIPATPPRRPPPNPLHRPNLPTLPDCQPTW